MTWQVGSWLFDDASLPSQHSAYFMAIDVSVITDRARFDAQLRALIDEIHATPTADDIDRVLVPGEREWERYHASKKDGIQLPSDVVEKLHLASEITGIVPNWLRK